MATVNLTADTLASTISEHEIVLIDFWASWCGPCRNFAPVYEAASEKHPDLVFGKVDTEAEQAIAASANITSIPTLMVFRDNILLYNQAGAMPATALEDLIGQVRDLDMDDVRAKMADSSPSPQA